MNWINTYKIEILFLSIFLYVQSIFFLEIAPLFNRISLCAIILISFGSFNLKNVKVGEYPVLSQIFFALPLFYSGFLLCNGNYVVLNILFPIFFLVFNTDIFKENNILDQVYKSLNISIVIVFIICLIGVGIRLYDDFFIGNSINNAVNSISKVYWWNYFVHKSLVSVLAIHPSYLSLFTLLSINKGFNNLFNNIKLRKIDKTNLFYLLTVTCFTIMIASKMAYLVLICFICLFLIRLIKLNFYKEFILVLFGTLFFLSLLYHFLPSIRDRITVDFRNFKQSGFALDNNSPASERIYIWKTSADIIMDNPGGLFCLNSKEVIWSHLKKSDKTALIEKNAHNNFLEFGVMYGFLGIIVLFIFSGYSIYLAIDNMDYVFLGVILIFLLFSIVESTLVREIGVIYMAFIFQLHLLKQKT